MRSESAIPIRRAKHFPLQLYEVLEAEFVSTHGPLSAERGWLLAAADICYAKLMEYLRAPFQREAGRAIVAIKDRLQQRGLAIAPDGPWSKELEASLLEAFNQALQADQNLYDHALLERDTTAWQFAELHANRATAKPSTARRDAEVQERAFGRGDVARDEQLQLNRLLLEAAFPADAIARVETVRLNALFIDCLLYTSPSPRDS